MAADFARRGIACAVMELPYHMRRLPRGISNLRLFTGSSMQTVRAFDQAASDVSTVARWLRMRPEVNSAKIGVVGLSLGAIITHMAMGRDERLSAGVAMLGGADLDRLRKDSFLARILHPQIRDLNPEEAAARRAIDPLTYTASNRPRRVLMIQAARDTIVPSGGAVKLWEALGRPPIRWVDSNHFGLFFGADSAARAAERYLLQVWEGTPSGAEQIPPVNAATFKLGFLSGLDSRFTPAVQWQAIPLGMRDDHMTLFHLNLGLSGRGPFGALSVTVNPSVDLGIGKRINGGGFRPFLSFHLVF